MGVFKLSVVTVVLVLVVVGNCWPAGPGYWGHWKYLHQDKAHQEALQKMMRPPAVQESRLSAAYQRQLQVEEQEEQEEERQAAVRAILEDFNLEDVALGLGMDALGTLAKPHITGDGPTCVNRRAPVTLPNLTPPRMGELVYTVCGAGDAASLHLRYQELGETTPSLDLTTPAATTTAAFPLCPDLPTTTPPATTTTTAEAQNLEEEIGETTAAEPETTTITA